jgi:UrcA family protein
METNFSVPSGRVRGAVTGPSILVLVVATLLVPLASHFSSAKPETPQRTQHVVYDYRDVTSSARVPALYVRFHREATQFCESFVRSSPVDARPQLECAERVVEAAVRRIDAPELTAYHQARKESAAVTRVASAR